MRHRLRQLLGLFERSAHWLFPIGALLVGLGIGVVVWAEKRRQLFVNANTAPELITLKDLVARGPDGNPNIILKDFAVSDNFVAEEFAGHWTMVWVAAIPKEDLPQGQSKPGELAVAPALIYTKNAWNKTDLFALCDQPRLQALVANSVMSLSEERQKRLRQTFAGTEMSKCLLLEEGRRPPELMQVVFELGCGILLMSAGVAFVGFFFLTLMKDAGFHKTKNHGPGVVSQILAQDQPLPTPQTLEEAQRQLGNSQATFRPGMENLVAGIVLGLLMIATGTGVCLYLLYKTLQNWADMPVFGPAGSALWPYLLFAALCSLLAAGGFFFIWFVRLLHQFRVIVCPGGLVSVQSNVVQVFPWEDIASVKETISQQYLPLKAGLKYAAPMGKARSYEVYMKNGSTFNFDGDWAKKLSTLTKIIKKETDVRGIPWNVVHG